MKKYNSSTGCYKIDIFANGAYLCSTEQHKTCKSAIVSVSNFDGLNGKKITAHFYKD